MAAMASFHPVHPQHNLPLCLLPNDLFDFPDPTNSGYSWLPEVTTLMSIFETGCPDWPAVPGIVDPTYTELQNIQAELFEPTQLSEQTAQPVKSPDETTSDDAATEDSDTEQVSHVNDEEQQNSKEFVTPDETVASEQRKNKVTATETERPARYCQSRYSLRSQLNASSYKQSRPTVRKTVVLWKFLEELLDKHDNNCIEWVSREEGVFKFTDSKLAARLWGQRKNKRHMTYEKLSRALRYYYERKIMYHDKTQKLIYRFGEAIMKDRINRSSDDSS